MNSLRVDFDIEIMPSEGVVCNSATWLAVQMQRDTEVERLPSKGAGPRPLSYDLDRPVIPNGRA